MSGRVTDGGQPVAGGTVTMTAPHGTTVSAGIRRDGRYSLAGLPPGSVKIGVVVTSAGGRPDPAGRAPFGGTEVPPGGTHVPARPDPATSGLTAELSRASNAHDIELH